MVEEKERKIIVNEGTQAEPLELVQVPTDIRPEIILEECDQLGFDAITTPRLAKAQTVDILLAKVVVELRSLSLLIEGQNVMLAKISGNTEVKVKSDDIKVPPVLQ